MKVERLSVAALERRAAHHDALVAMTPGIDPFCSRTDWTLPARVAFHPDAEPLIVAGDAGYVSLLVSTPSPGHRLVHGMESMWEMASAVVGPDPEGLADLVVAALAEARPYALASIPGLPPRGAPLTEALIARLGAIAWVGIMPEPARRVQASLAGGVGGFLARRSANMRRSVRRARRRAEEAGIVVVAGEGSDGHLIARIMDVERRSWKGRDRAGIEEGPMRRFYGEIVPRLRARGALRLLFARRGGDDVGYILGGVAGPVYRGLQFSFDEAWRAIGVGTVLQIAQVEALVQEGIQTYDLGMDMPYKRRFGERVVETITLVSGM